MKKFGAALAAAVAVVLAGYHALTLYDNDFRYGRMRETPAIKPHEEPLLPMEAGLVPLTGGDGLLRLTPPEELSPPFALEDPLRRERGRAVYFTFCAQCHGPHYDGQGTVGQSFAPLPTDLRAAQVQEKPAGLLFHTVSYGIPGGRQPALDTTIPIVDRWCVVAFIRSLGPRP
ncbi:MAG: cytochrome c [Desulfobacterales bacterium]